MDNKKRFVSKIALEKNGTRFGRIIVLTGARQTGKTTLVKKTFDAFPYLSIEDPRMAEQYMQMTAQQWKTVYPLAILDEIQKQPTLIESIKSVYDQWDEPRYILLGSSQLLLMKKVRESLAGRCAILELFPLTLPELRTTSWNDTLLPSQLVNIVTSRELPVFLPAFTMDPLYALKMKAFEHYATFGGYPAISDDTLTSDERFQWLGDYVKTYLERDIRDIASFNELEPFVKIQRYMAQNTGTLVNASSIASEANVTVKTVQRYINYLEISYQAFLLQPWSRNTNKRLMKTPKCHFMDHGIVQAVVKKRGGTTGNEFESLVVAEIYKQLKTLGLPVTLYHLRTHDGKEVDLLVECADFYLAFEIKMSERVQPTDARHLRHLQELLDKPLLHSFVLSLDVQTRQLADNITAIHVAYMLG